MDSSTTAPVLDCAEQAARPAAFRAACDAIGHGGLIVLPTDTVYGIAADARDSRAVAALLAAKGRGRNMPPPVLVADPADLDGIVQDVPPAARVLMDAFWPGALTIVLPTHPDLTWDLGDLVGTVAVRIPDLQVTRDLLRATGPLAVSSANRTGQPPARTAQEARDQLGDRVRLYLDAGPAPGGVASTVIDFVVDAQGAPAPRVLRQGAIDAASLRRVVSNATGGVPEDQADGAGGEGRA
ncbi:MAG: threonylcarbamoyl-AMP synthase [Bifidobacteriaceae bacterium]|jgi:tRNA threonylcarbamoyl adenosine modification protein (Sua5/YciO/YrdC/YwlC family)|nr:threonylcarbamoyl-AMP synthase [Bifidobacteriaceae bacterium]